MACPSYYVVCLHRNCNAEAASYISNALTQSLTKGGAELIVRQVRDLFFLLLFYFCDFTFFLVFKEKMEKDSTGLILHVSATDERLLEVSLLINLKESHLLTIKKTLDC